MHENTLATQLLTSNQRNNHLETARQVTKKDTLVHLILCGYDSLLVFLTCVDHEQPGQLLYLNSVDKHRSA